MLEEGYTRGYVPVLIPSTALVRQIAKGAVQVNVANYGLNSFDSLLQMLGAGSNGIHVLKLHSQGRSVNARGPPSHETSQGMGVGCDPFGHDSYIAAVDHASYIAQHASQRKKLQGVLLDILSHAPITELHIGMRLATSGYTAISAGLQRSKTLRKLSFAGSRMGDARVGLLLGGIIGCQSLEVLDLTSCDLSQEAVHTISLAIKEHMQQRVRMMFAATLRVHLDSSLPPSLARQVYETDLSNAHHAVEERCGGIKALHLPYNPKITDNVALHLKDALSMESTMQLLNLQGCGLSLAVEKEFVDLVREHVSLVRVDLRHGRGRKGHRLGLIRLRPPKLPPQGHEEQPAVQGQSEEELTRSMSNSRGARTDAEQPAVRGLSEEEENVRLQVLLKVVPAGHQVSAREPGSSHEEASTHIRESSHGEASAHIRESSHGEASAHIRESSHGEASTHIRESSHGEASAHIEGSSVHEEVGGPMRGSSQEEASAQIRGSRHDLPDNYSGDAYLAQENVIQDWQCSSKFIEEASAHIGGHMGSSWQPMSYHKWTQTSSKAGTKKRGRCGRRGRRKARQKGGHTKERATLGGRKQSAKINQLLTEGSDMLLRGYLMRLQLQHVAADGSGLTQGSKKKRVGGCAERSRWGNSVWGEDPRAERLQQEGSGRGPRRKLAEGRAARRRWGDSIWGEDPEELQQGGGAEGKRRRQQEDAQRQKEEGTLTEVVELLRRLELAVSKKEYAQALRSHPGALDDAQPMVRLLPGSSTADQHGSSNGGRSGLQNVRLEQQQRQQSVTAAAVQSGGHAQELCCAPSLSTLKEAWVGADQALRMCGAAVPAPRATHQMVHQEEAPALGSAGTEESQKGEGHGQRTAREESRSSGQKERSAPPGVPKTLAGDNPTALAQCGLREAAVCARLEQLAALCNGFTGRPKMERRHQSI